MEKSIVVSTNNLPKIYFNWSGGKDSSLALHYILQQKFKGSHTATIDVHNLSMLKLACSIYIQSSVC